MQTLEVTAAELAIGQEGYNEAYPTKQQETLCSIYIKNLYKRNGAQVFIESGDVAAATTELQSALSAVTLPVKYASWLPSVIGMACDVISLTSSSSIIVRDIGINAIDRLVDHCIRVLFDNLFNDEAPEGESSGETPSAIKELTAELVTLRDTINTVEGTLYDESNGKLFRLSGAGVELEG